MFLFNLGHIWSLFVYALYIPNTISLLFECRKSDNSQSEATRGIVNKRAAAKTTKWNSFLLMFGHFFIKQIESESYNIENFYSTYHS